MQGAAGAYPARGELIGIRMEGRGVFVAGGGMAKGVDVA